jgi:nicotinamide riboside kinase
VVLALVGAESTGKSTLAQSLHTALADHTGLATTWVPEVLREWCDAAARTPREDEQRGIADEQARRIALACTSHDLVVCDTTPLMTAVYHRQVFGSHALDAMAVQWQREHCDLTLLTALDLPWQADGLQRDGPQVRAPVDATLRELLLAHGLPFAVVAGLGQQRLASALDAVTPLLSRLASPRQGLFTRLAGRDAAQPEWPWYCENCDSPECEHRLQALARRAPGSVHGR